VLNKGPNVGSPNLAVLFIPSLVNKFVQLRKKEFQFEKERIHMSLVLDQKRQKRKKKEKEKRKRKGYPDCFEKLGVNVGHLAGQFLDIKVNK